MCVSDTGDWAPFFIHQSFSPEGFGVIILQSGGLARGSPRRVTHALTSVVAFVNLFFYYLAFHWLFLFLLAAQLALFFLGKNLCLLTEVLRSFTFDVTDAGIDQLGLKCALWPSRLSLSSPFSFSSVAWPCILSGLSNIPGLCFIFSTGFSVVPSIYLVIYLVSFGIFWWLM